MKPPLERLRTGATIGLLALLTACAQARNPECAGDAPAFGSALQAQQWCDYRYDYVKAHPDLDRKTRQAILAGRIFTGMTESQVLASWGQPHSRNTYNAGAMTQWVYGYLDYYYNFVPNRFVYFEGGIVTDWQSLGG